MTRTFLTGGSGFVAAHILDELIKEGHSVVFSVRSKAKADKVLSKHKGVPKSRLDYVIVEDIAKEGAFDEALKSDPPFEAVIHSCSPFFTNSKNPQEDLIAPAINGTKDVLRAVKEDAPTVKRVVITSSFAAIIDPSKGFRPGHTYTEADWNPVTLQNVIDDPANGYRYSKTAAEKTAWDFVKTEKPNFTITTMNPPLVLGPIHPHLQSLSGLNTSNQRVADIITGKYRTADLPDTGTFVFVDVRDLAKGHVHALTDPLAENQRFFFTAGHFTNEQIADVIRESYPDLQDKLPAKGAKGTGGFPDGGVYNYDNSRSRKLLGTEFRSLKESIVDTVPTLRAIGA